MRRHWAYFKYIIFHKYFVLVECIRLGVPIWITVLHDWDKFLPDEWIPYATTFYKPDGSRQYKPSLQFDYAWNLHQKRNKHHHQFWLLTRDTGETVALQIPNVYLIEMIADWKGTGKALGRPDTKAWYLDNKDKMILHPQTRNWISQML